MIYFGLEETMKKMIVLAVLLLVFAACGTNPLMESIQKLVAWDSSVTYDKGDFTNRTEVVYRSLQNSNKGHDPAVEPLWWTLDN
jgi:hypothetical protein